MKKYELIKINVSGLFRIRALRDFSDVKAGDIGGFVAGEHNLSHEDDCWIYDMAEVFENAKVSDNAKVFGFCKLFNNAKVYGNATLSDRSFVFGNAQVYGNARVCEYVKVYGSAVVSGSARVSGNVKLSCFGAELCVSKVDNDTNTSKSTATHNNCECGAKYTSNPNHHTKWCPKNEKEGV